MKLYQLVTLLAATLISFSVTAAESTNTIPKMTAEVGEPIDPTEDISQDCSLGCALGWTVTASSHLKKQGIVDYTAEKINDGLAATAWIEGVEGDGIGEYVTFSFPKFMWPKGMEKINFNGFRIINGYLKSKELWKANSRVKTMRIYVQNKPVYDVLLNDTMTVQEARFDSIYITPGDTVKVEIMSVYKGSRYSDTAISELVPMGAH